MDTDVGHHTHVKHARRGKGYSHYGSFAAYAGSNPAASLL